MNNVQPEILQAELVHEECQQQDEERQQLEPIGRNALALGGLHYADDFAMAAAVKQKAEIMKSLVVQAGAVQKIQGREYVKVEGWLMLAQLCGSTPVIVSVEDMGDGAYLATAELHAVDGRVLQRADAICGDDTDKPWHLRPKFARRSMAQTRAIGKVCRMTFSPVMALGGFMPTPAEEMPATPSATPPPASDPKLVDALIANGVGLDTLLEALAKMPDDPSGEELETAAIVWDEISDEHKIALWKSTRGKGGVFTSAEKKLMQSTEFRLARPSTREAIARESASQSERDDWDQSYNAAEEEKITGIRPNKE